MPRDRKTNPRTSWSSSRDPGGRVLLTQRHVYRGIRSAGVSDLRRFQDSPTVAKFVQAGSIIESEEVNLEELTREEGRSHSSAAPFDSSWQTVVRHPRLEPLTYPVEWTPTMLWAAASLTLDIAEGLLSEGLCLKDGSAYNLVFANSKPTFVDILSISKRDPLDPVWWAYGQFNREFIGPLLLHRLHGTSVASIFALYPRGPDPRTLLRSLSMQDARYAMVWRHVLLPVALEKVGKRLLASDETLRSRTDNLAKRNIEHTFGALRNTLEALRPRVSVKSPWEGYYSEEHSQGYHEAKDSALHEILEKHQPSSVLDIGAHIGRHSRISASHGASVTALDLDERALDRLFISAQKERLRIVPLVANLAEPTGGGGWLGLERLPLLERLEERYDCVIAFAVWHHLLVSGGADAMETLSLIGRMSRDLIVLEFVPNDDPKMRMITGGIGARWNDTTLGSFRDTVTRLFRIEQELTLRDSTRVLFVLRHR